MRTANLTLYCSRCGEAHGPEDECKSRESKRDRKRREKSEHESRLYAGLSQMEGDGR